VSAAKPFSFTGRKSKVDWEQRCLLQSEVIIGWSDGIHHRTKKKLRSGAAEWVYECVCGGSYLCCLVAYLLQEMEARHAERWRASQQTDGQTAGGISV